MPGASPLGLVEQPALGQLAGLVAVKAEVAVDTARVMLDPQDEDRRQGEDAHGQGHSYDPFHGGGW